MTDSDTTVIEDPTIIDREAKDAPPKGYLTTEEEPTELVSVTFEAGGTERTISVGDRFIADNGQVVGEIERIYRAENDPASRIHSSESTHWVYLDYSVGGYWEDSSGTGGLPLGETAKQMAAGDMTTER
jgi:hypothetical protein